MTDSEWKNYPESPFAEPLLPADFALDKGYKLKVMAGYPEIVIRKGERPVMKVDDSYEHDPLVKMYRRGKELFEELRVKYRISVPEMQFIITKDEKGDPTLYTVTQKIHGYNVEELLPAGAADEQFESEIEDLELKLVNYLIEKYQKKEDGLFDFSHAQFVYGRRKGESEDHFYLVDIEPAYYQGESMIYSTGLTRVAKMIVEAETRFGGKHKKAREVLKDFFDSQKDERKGFDYVKKILGM